MEGSKRIAAACGLAAVVCCLLWDGSVLAHPGIDEQIADVTARIAEDPKDAGLYLKRGELHRIHLDWAAAEADYLRARGLDPGLDAVDLGLGTLRLDAGKPAEALEALDRFLEQRPDHVPERLDWVPTRFTCSQWFPRATASFRNSLLPPSFAR